MQNSTEKLLPVEYQTPPKKEERVYAGFFVRLAAYWIDWLIVGAALLVIRIPVWIFRFSGRDGIFTDSFLFQYSLYDLLLYALKITYFVLLTYYTGSTLGKKLFHLSVASVEERKPTFFEILYRESVGKFLSGLLLSIGYLMVGLDKKKRGLHDHLADTCVVYRHQKIIYVATPVTVQERPFISTQMQTQTPEPDVLQKPDSMLEAEESQEISNIEHPFQ